MAKIPALNSIRVIPRENDFLERRIGSRGEIFFDQELKTLRLYDGINPGGITLLRADLDNIEGQISSVFVGATPPSGVDEGTIWFDSTTAKLYIYYNDGNSFQWIQPATTAFGGGGGGGGASAINDLVDVSIVSPSSGQVLKYNGTAWVNDADSTSSGSVNLDSLDDVTISGPSNGQILKYNGSVWVNQNETASATNLNALTDVTISNLSTNQILKYNGSQWVNTSDTGGVSGLTAGTGISVSSATGNVTVTNTGVTQILAGDNITVDHVGSVWTVNAVVGSGGGGITLEESQDGAASLFSNGTHSGISFVYNDAANAISATVGNIVLGEGTTGSYIATISTTSGLTGGSIGSEGTNISLGIDTAIVATLTGTQTLTGKTISGSNNTLSNIANASLTNSSLTINGSSVSLGGSVNLNINSLSDVTITTASTNQILRYNGTAWVNSAEQTVSINSFSTIAVSGQNSVVADSSSDTLTLVAGSGISLTTNNTNDEITIESTVTLPTFATLTESAAASLTIDKIYLQAITRIVVTNSGNSAYLFDQYSGNNPTIYALSGTTIAFELNCPGHPFLIQDGTATNYNTGLVHVSSTGEVTTGSNAQGYANGTLYWKVPSSISGTYRYQCSAHVPMVGAITVKSFASI